MPISPRLQHPNIQKLRKARNARIWGFGVMAEKFGTFVMSVHYILSSWFYGSLDCDGLFPDAFDTLSSSAEQG